MTSLSCEGSLTVVRTSSFVSDSCCLTVLKQTSRNWSWAWAKKWQPNTICWLFFFYQILSLLLLTLFILLFTCLHCVAKQLETVKAESCKVAQFYKEWNLPPLTTKRSISARDVSSEMSPVRLKFLGLCDKKNKATKMCFCFPKCVSKKKKIWKGFCFEKQKNAPSVSTCHNCAPMTPFTLQVSHHECHTLDVWKSKVWMYPRCFGDQGSPADSSQRGHNKSQWSIGAVQGCSAAKQVMWGRARKETNQEPLWSLTSPLWRQPGLQSHSVVEIKCWENFSFKCRKDSTSPLSSKISSFLRSFKLSRVYLFYFKCNKKVKWAVIISVHIHNSCAP